MTARAEEAGEAGEHEENAEDQVSLRWVSWLLVVVAVLPPVVLAEVARRFLTGSADGNYFGPYVSADEVRARLGLTFSVRFRLLWASVPVPDVLVASLPVVLALAAVVVAGRPDRLVPPRWGRRVVAGGAVLAALESLTCLVMLVQLTDAPRSDAYGNLQLSYLLPSTGAWPEIAPVLAVLVVTAAVPLVAAFVLWTTGAPQPVAEPAQPAGAVVGPGDESRPEPAVVEPPPVGPPPGPQARDVPRPSAAELDAYRRPGS